MAQKDGSLSYTPTIDFELKRRAVKNLRISVSAPDGKVEVVAPKGLSQAAINDAIYKRINWIRKHQQRFLEQKRPQPLQMISGETHYLWGNPYTLDITHRHGKHEVSIHENNLHMYVRPNTSFENKVAVLDSFYRQQLIEVANPMFDYWCKTLDLSFKQWRIRKMKTRWGSCSPYKGHILLNLELAKKPFKCLEYVVLHELLHLIEPSHNKYFHALLDAHMADWRQRQDLLNKSTTF